MGGFKMDDTHAQPPSITINGLQRNKDSEEAHRPPSITIPITAEWLDKDLKHLATVLEEKVSYS